MHMFSRSLMVLMLMLPALAEAAGPALAAPFGIVINKTTCEEVARAHGAPIGALNGTTAVNLPEPDRLYPGASEIQALCEAPETHVLYLNVTIEKDGAAVQAAFKSLQKYKLQQGARPPSVGDGYALFRDAAGRFIQLSAPHLAFTFTVTYVSPDVYDHLAAKAQMRRATQIRQQQGL